ncbi:ribosome biogenesis GTP-binding protein YihA/YsxC [Ferrigenium sp. UT5]|uniref:ribosome biogenesis GTP-binding protein YihA/YsxC n=1 Tax=Ferrigenium sp. UT5 TaxID=3242105 RepID=UPI0035542100
MGLFSKATFFTTVNHLKDLPLHGGKEVAFVGRSNAGKSSAINTLANHVRLAFTSKTPGRTQHLNFFDLGDNCYVVDLPGYGYAKVPPDVQAHWEFLLGQYLQTRAELCGLVIIMDARHPLTERDQVMLDWFAPTGKPVHILLTKADKLSRQQATKTLREVKEFLGAHFSSDITPASGDESSPKPRFPQCSVQLFSSLKKTGRDEAEAVIGGWFQDGQAKKCP